MVIKSFGLIEKANKLTDGEVEFVVSTEAWDSHGERIRVEGINISSYKKNPVVLWGHDGFNLPIAKATKVWKESGKLMARAKFYLKDDFARKVYEYIIDGFLNAVSIGGTVEEWDNDGMTINKMVMKEFSVVSVPANPEAIATAKSLDGEQKAELRSLANAYARKMLEKDNGETDITKNIDALETLVATLREVAVKSETQEVSAEPITKRVVLRQAQVVVQQAEKVIKVIKKESLTQ